MNRAPTMVRPAANTLRPPWGSSPPALVSSVLPVSASLANRPTGQLVNEWHRPPGFFAALRTMD